MLDKTPGKGKLDPRGIQCIFLGYDETSKGFPVWVPKQAEGNNHTQYKISQYHVARGKVCEFNKYRTDRL